MALMAIRSRPVPHLIQNCSAVRSVDIELRDCQIQGTISRAIGVPIRTHRLRAINSRKSAQPDGLGTRGAIALWDGEAGIGEGGVQVLWRPVCEPPGVALAIHVVPRAGDSFLDAQPQQPLWHQ